MQSSYSEVWIFFTGKFYDVVFITDIFPLSILLLFDSLLLRPFPPPVFDHLQYTKTEKWTDLDVTQVTCSDQYQASSAPLGWPGDVQPWLCFFIQEKQSVTSMAAVLLSRSTNTNHGIWWALTWAPWFWRHIQSGCCYYPVRWWQQKIPWY